MVGRGTFGTVYKARMHDKTVAVKSYDAESEFKAFTVEVIISIILKRNYIIGKII